MEAPWAVLDTTFDDFGSEVLGVTFTRLLEVSQPMEVEAIEHPP